MSIDEQINEVFEPVSKAAFDVVLYSVDVAGNDVKLLLILFI